ncbi:energy transducer TonB [Neisseria animalis]|uniref:Protein TonB n=1 Tax=Neisseria animalis TaxID=492 RepID=A0A5P3MW02_NEIAN|nr:energy transducer TonB [Neisseria animalis]QEY24941.1 TonB family protein [Neisseria animalis]ROW32899.1 TonB family protein [Neisseria animalis]
MKHEQIINPTVVAVVALLHIGLLALLWRAVPLRQEVIEHIEFIELGDFGGGNGAAEGAGMPVAEKVALRSEQPKPKPKTKAEQPKPKAAAPEKPVIKPVISKKADADIQQPKPAPKPAAKPKPAEKVPTETKQHNTPEPKPQAEPAPKAEKPAVAKPEGKPVSAKAEGKPAAKSDNAGGAGGGANEHKGSGSGIKGEGSGRGEGSGGGSGGKKGEHGAGNGGSGGSVGSSKSNPIKSGGSIPRPPYPPSALENGEEGRVVLEVLVAPGGKVNSVKVVKSSGSSSLDRAARNAAKKGGFNAAAWTLYTIPVNFSLN